MPPEVHERRWIARPVVASGTRAAVAVAPGAAGVLAGIGFASVVPTPPGAAFVAWLGALLVAACLAIAVVERAGRRLLPLSTLLRLSLVFPDRVPSRFRIAREAGRPRVLEERVRHARDRGLDDDPSVAAAAILTLVAALSAHDRKTRGHSERVRAFTDMLAVELGLSASDRDRLRWSALLHDIGKLEVPSRTLNKVGKPDEGEWELIRRHPLEGERIAAPLLPWLGEWGSVIGQHHERFDGAGYPRELRGNEIGRGARIVSLADAFEVMTAPRSYKRPMTPSAARRELARCAGTQFDPGMVRAFFGVSIGRLWWTVGPVSWLAQLPFALRVGRTGGRAISLARAGTAVVTQAAAGVLALSLAGWPAVRAAESPGSAPTGAPTPRPSAAATVGETVETLVPDTAEPDAPDAARDPGADADATDEEADDGGSVVTDVVDAVSDVAETVDEVADTVGDVAEDLGGTVGEAVDETTSTVDDLADGLGL